MYRRPAVRTELSIYDFAKIMNLDIPELFQYGEINVGERIPRKRVKSGTACNNVVYQFSETASEFSRYMLSEAILQAERLLAEYLNYYPLGGYICKERQPWQGPSLDDWRQWPGDYLTYVSQTGCCNKQTGTLPLIQTRYGNVKAFGRYQLELVASEAEITLAPSFEGSMVNDCITGSIELPVDFDLTQLGDDCCHGEDLSDFRMYYANSELGSTLDMLDWEVRPVQWSLDISTRTLSFQAPSILATAPNRWLGYNVDVLALNDPSNFVERVDIYYQRIVSDCDNAMLQWGEDCGSVTHPACIEPQNYEYGFFKAVPVEVDDTADPPTCTQIGLRNHCNDVKPQEVVFDYISECPCADEVNCKRMVAYLAAALLECFPCECGCDDCKQCSKLERYAHPESVEMRAADQSKVLLRFNKIESNPWSANYGAVLAYEIAQRLKIEKSLVLGGF